MLTWKDLKMQPPKQPTIFLGNPPWLTAGSIHMIWGETGIGKSFVSTALAIGLAAGVPVLGFACPAPRRVLYVDGEMSRAMLYKRISWLIKGFGLTPEQAERVEVNLGLYDLTIIRENGGLNLTLVRDQKKITRDADSHGEDGSDVVFLDNLSALAQVEDDNAASSWNPMVPWLTAEREIGRALILIHHAGKDPRRQRGTSRREDLLDTSIGLIRPRARKGDRDEEDEAELPEGARSSAVFWYWKKTRDFPKPDPFQINIETDKLREWAQVTAGVEPEVARAEQEQRIHQAVEAVRDRVKQGLKPDFRGVAEEFAVNYSTLTRRYKQAYPHET